MNSPSPDTDLASLPKRPIVVVGGGAAGLMAALFSARSGQPTLLLEGSGQCGLKILVSGGGRCNVLPSQSSEQDFFTSGSRNILRRLFRTWPLAEIEAFFERDLGIPLVLEPDTGKLFPASQSSKEVRDKLVAVVERAGARILTKRRVASIEPSGLYYNVLTATGEHFAASRVIGATGGKSLPRTGSDGWGYEMARRLGHSILLTYPALVPLRTDRRDLLELSGISLPVGWSAVDEKGKVLEARQRELLFTHRGFSGPAMLDASHWSVRDGREILIDWGAEGRPTWEARFQDAGKRQCGGVVAGKLPKRLTAALFAEANIDPSLPLAQLRRSDRERLLTTLCRYSLPVSGDVGYRAAEVTGGGIPLSEIKASTLESRVLPGLYLCGEILDVIGRMGGFNFLWAWVTGRLAGESAARSIGSVDRRSN